MHNVWHTPLQKNSPGEPLISRLIQQLVSQINSQHIVDLMPGE